MIKERRKHPRLRIPLEAEYLVAGREEWRQGTIWTLGAGGAALLCEEELDLGTEIAGLHFLIEAEGDLPETRIEVGAEVVNIDRKADFGRFSNFMLGLRFTGLGEQEFELLKQFVFRRLTGSQGAAARRSRAAESEGLVKSPIEIRFKLFDEFVEEVSENLSPSGMFIRAHRPLPPGSRFKFQFQLGEDFSLFQGTAEVVWTRRRSEGPDRPPGMGVRFVNLDLTSQKMVDRLVDQRHGEAPDHGDEGADEPRSKKASAALKLSEDAEPFAIEPEVPAPAGGSAEPEPEAAAPPAADEGSPRAAGSGRKVARLKKRLGDMEAARDEERDRAARLAGESEALQEEVEALRAENRSLQESRDEAEEARGRAETEASELRQELELLKPDDDLEERLQAELREGLERAAEVEAELRGKLERADETEKELRRHIEQAGETEQGLREKLEGALETETELRESLQRAGETEAEARQSLEQAAATETELREQLAEAEGWRDEVDRQTERADDAETRLERLEQELGEARQEWRATESELRAQLEQKASEESDLNDRLAEAVGAEAELRQRLGEVRGARDELELRLAQSDQIETELRDQAQELRTARDEMAAKLLRATARLDRMRGAAERMRSRFDGDLSAAEALGADLASHLDEVAEVGAGLDRKVERLSEARSNLAVRLKRITEAWSSLEEGLDEAEPEDVVTGAAPPPEALEPEPEPVPAAAAAKPGAGQEPEPVAAAEVPAEPEKVLVETEACEPEAPAETGEPSAAARSDAAAEPSPAVEALPSEPPDEPPPAVEAPPSEPPDEPSPARGAARLVGAARRAVARLGFGRRSPSSDNGGNGHAGPVAVDGPVAEAASPAAAEGGDPAAIEETVKAWAAAWSERRVEDYLSFYSSEFEPTQAAGGDHEDGAARAWLPPLAGMELTLGPISQTEMAPGRFAVHFEQSVESDSYSRRTGRTLEMVREADSWKIAAESFQDLPN